MSEPNGSHHVQTVIDNTSSSELKAAHSALAAAALNVLNNTLNAPQAQQQQQQTKTAATAVSTTKLPEKNAQSNPPKDDEPVKAKTVRQVRQERKRKIQKEAKEEKKKSKKPNNQKPIVVATTDTGEEFYEMEDVVGRRTNRGRVEYLIKWKGCPHSDNTWEPTTNLCDTALTACLEFSRKEKQKRLQQSQDEERLGLTGDKKKNTNGESTAKGIGGVKNEPPIEEQLKDEQNTPVADHWKWTDEEHVVFREIERINVHEKNVRQRVTDARVNGTPIVLVGHVGWANFAKKWLKPLDNGSGDGNSNSNTSSILNGNGGIIPKDSSDSKQACDDPSQNANNEKPAESPWLDLSKPHELDIDRMIDDIGYEEVPVVKRDYNEMNPILGKISASRFLQTCWPKNYTKNMKKTDNSSRLYLHQWQFPLSDTAGRKLCHQNNPLPNGIMGDDLLRYWSDLPQCKLDSPLQYIFMGRDDTVSKLHRDNGGLEISIAPIQGEKECTLVHRADGATCLYHLNAQLDDVDINTYPLMSQARIWKTTVRPGEILLMPHGTYHQCRNITPCLSYSRFHLDTVNLAPFLQSMIDEDAEEISHDEVLWNCTSELIKQVDVAVLAARDKVKNKEPIPSLTEDVIRTVDTLRTLRHIVREIARRDNKRNAAGNNDDSFEDTGEESAYNNDNGPQWYIAKEDDTPKMIAKRFNLKTADLVKGNIKRLPDLLCNSRLKEGTRIKVSHLYDKNSSGCDNNQKNRHDWNILVDDVDMSLHEFRYRQHDQIPPFRPRQWKLIDNVVVGRADNTEGQLMTKADVSTLNTLVNDSTNDKPSSPPKTEADRDERASDSLSPNSKLSIRSCQIGNDVTVRLKTGQYSNGTILNVEHNMHAAYLSFDEYPATYDEFEPYEKLRIPFHGSPTGVEVRHEDVKPGLVVLQLKERGEVYRASVQFTTYETMYRIRLHDITEGPKDRWFPRKAIVQDPPQVKITKPRPSRKQKKIFDVEGDPAKPRPENKNGAHQTNALDKISAMINKDGRRKKRSKIEESKMQELVNGRES